MNKAEKKKWIRKLRPFWKNRKLHYSIFRQAEFALEKKMKKELGEDLEFFYGDMHEGCLGIGHTDYNRRNSKKKGYFPLFQNSEFMR